MTRYAKFPFLFVVVCAPLAIAQNTVGELLDAGATKMSRGEFTEQLVQRVLVGPTPNGGSLEIIYTTTGVVQGTGRTPRFIYPARIAGDWTFDDSSRVCSSMRSRTHVYRRDPSAALPILVQARRQVFPLRLRHGSQRKGIEPHDQAMTRASTEGDSV